MTRTRLLPVLLLAVLLCPVMIAGRQIVVSSNTDLTRTTPPVPKGTGLVLGRTIDASSGKVIAGVMVQVSMPGASLQPLITDDEGRFVARDLPKGALTIYASKPGYVPGYYGKPVPIDIDNRGQSLDLADGDRVGDVSITLWKYAVIEGVVTDESGDPIVGTTVRALPRRVIAGRSQLAIEPGAIPFGTYTARTDDRGVYRLDSLPPGDYIIAVPVVTWSAPKARPPSVSPSSAAYSSSNGLMTWSGGGRGGGAGTGGIEAGDELFGLVNLGGPTDGLAGVTRDGRPLVYETQFFPGTSSLSRATGITLSSGETRSSVDFLLRPVPALKIAGTVSGPGDTASNLTLRLVKAEMASTSSDAEVAITTTDATGRFVFLGVTPGQYVLRAVDVPQPRRSPSPSPSTMVTGPAARTIMIIGAESTTIPDEPVLWTDVPISVGDRDVSDVAAVLHPGFRITGSVEFEGDAERPRSGRDVSVSIVRADGQRTVNYALQTGPIDAQWRLTTYGQVPGRYLLRIGTPQKWFLAGAFLGGRDVSVVPFDLTNGDADGVVIKLTSVAPASLRGTITNGRGQPATTASAIVFPADRERWVDTGPNPRALRVVGAGHAGVYVADNLPSGDYFVAAVAEVTATWADPRNLETLARTASRVTVHDHEQVTQDVRLSDGRDRDETWPPRGHGPFVPEFDQAQTRDAPAVATAGTGRVEGVMVLDAQARTPASRVRVTLAGDAARGARTVITGDTGRFDFAGLPAGRYTLTASKAAYLGATYGATRLGGAGTTIVLAEGQALTGITLTIQKGGVVTGLIRDERGQPVHGAQVEALQARVTNGERQFFGSGTSQRTDDRGMYRIYGLAPGEYFITASLGFAGTSAHPTTAADVQFAQQALQRSVVAPLATPAATGATARAVSPATVRYAAVMYPGVVTTAEAQPIKLAPAEERTGVDMSLRLVPTVRLAGTVVNPGGAPPANLDVRLLSVGDDVPSNALDLSLAFPVRPDAAGHFSYQGVPPGSYVVAATTQAQSGRGGRGAAEPAPSLWGLANVDVNGVDVSNVIVSLQPGMSVAGRVRFVATTETPPADLTSVRVSLSPVLTGTQVAVAQTGATAAADGTFTFTGLTPGRYNLRGTLAAADARAGWLVTSVTAGDRDVTDQPLEVVAGANITNASIVFSDRPAELGGTLQDVSGRPATDYFVVMLPADPARWRSTARRVQQVRPSSDGKFQFRALLAGDYLLAASTDLDPQSIGDPAVLAVLARGAVKVTIAEGEKKVQNLRIGGGT